MYVIVSCYPVIYGAHLHVLYRSIFLNVSLCLSQYTPDAIGLWWWWWTAKKKRLNIMILSVVVELLVYFGYGILANNAPINVMPHPPHPGLMWGQGGD